MTLGFEDNQFVLQNTSEFAAIECPEDFKRVQLDTFVTKNIKAAARFRSHADSKAERIFNKLMLRSVALPPRGVFSPKDLPLMDFQLKRGVPHILKNSKSYIAHEPGLGKSAQAICAVSSKPGPAIIVCPGFLKITWAREITKWFVHDFPFIQIVPETARQGSMDWGADFIIVSDAMITKPWVLEGLKKVKARYLFGDEAHRYKEPTTTRTVAMFGGQLQEFKSSGLIYGPEHVSLLSGTPLLNKTIELWPALYAMAPETIDFMPYQDFGYHYGGVVTDDRGRPRFVGSANEDELRERIMGRFMQRITKREVLKDLPPKVREVIYVDRDTRKPDAIALDHDLLRKLRTKDDFEIPDSLGEYARVRHLNGLAKIGWAAGYLQFILEAYENESVICFCHHRDVAQGIAKMLHKFAPMVLLGGMDDERRTKIEDLFQAGRRRLIVGNIEAMNLGLTLTRGNRAVFAEYEWTPALNTQAEDRLDRIGQKNSVLCQYLVLPNSIDEAILKRCMEKEIKNKKVMGDK